MGNEYKPKLLSIRNDMKVLVADFDKVIKHECRDATRDNRESIKEKLLVAAKGFATKYGELQSRYVKLLFLEDLKEVAGEKTAELCLKFMEKGKE